MRKFVCACFYVFYRWSRKYRNNNMASSRAALSSSQFTPTQPRLHGACILPGHILVNERFHESDVVKTLQGNDSNVFFSLILMVRGYFAPKFKNVKTTWMKFTSADVSHPLLAYIRSIIITQRLMQFRISQEAFINLFHMELFDFFSVIVT